MFRHILLGLICFGVVSCSAVEKTTGLYLGNKNTPVEIEITAATDINPDLNSSPSPVLVRLFFLSARSNFDNASYDVLFSKQDGGLAGEFITVRDILLAPGAEQRLQLEKTDQVMFIGAVAGYRKLDAIRWKDAIIAEDALLGSTKIQIQVEAQAIRILK